MLETVDVGHINWTIKAKGSRIETETEMLRVRNTW
jgi:hypothetical protein